MTATYSEIKPGVGPVFERLDQVPTRLMNVLDRLNSHEGRLAHLNARLSPGMSSEGSIGGDAAKSSSGLIDQIAALLSALDAQVNRLEAEDRSLSAQLFFEEVPLAHGNIAGAATARSAR